jgi:hypothetical protein
MTTLSACFLCDSFLFPFASFQPARPGPGTVKVQSSHVDSPRRRVLWRARLWRHSPAEPVLRPASKINPGDALTRYLGVAGVVYLMAVRQQDSGNARERETPAFITPLGKSSDSLSPVRGSRRQTALQGPVKLPGPWQGPGAHCFASGAEVDVRVCFPGLHPFPIRRPD